MKTLYSVHFIDHEDGLYNHALLECNSIKDICEYMEMFGHKIIKIEVREQQ